MSNQFDAIAVVVDWLDSCRRRDLGALLEFYAAEGSIECHCDGALVSKGRARLASYWHPRLDSYVPNAFELEEIHPTPDGVQLDYGNHDGMPVRMTFSFSPDGKILRTCCSPVPQSVLQGASSA